MTSVSINNKDVFSLFVNTNYAILSESKASLFNRVNVFFVCRDLVKDISAINKFIRLEENSLIKGIYTLEKGKLQDMHTQYKLFIDKLEESLPTIKKTWITRSLIKILPEFISNLKVFEMHTRAAAYPDRNEILLTYDELKELAQALEGWECASEQSSPKSHIA